MTGDHSDEGPWNPGLTSTIPRRLQSQITLFSAANALMDHATLAELSDLCGLPTIELACLKPQRLIEHELLVRVTADYSVPDGPNYADLGISLRTMVGRLWDRHVASEKESLCSAVEQAHARARTYLRDELAVTLEGRMLDAKNPDAKNPDANAASRDEQSALRASTVPERNGELRGLPRWIAAARSALTGKSVHKVASPLPSDTPVSESREQKAIQAWRSRLSAESEDAFETTCLEALVRSVDAIVAHRGRLLASTDTVATIAFALAANTLGERVIASLIGPIVTRGATAEGFRSLPSQSEPIVMNVKGASASGKSTIRPRQRALADTLGIPWEDFALISPDYWRKYLLDYESLGDDRRYGAMLCGQELAMVDGKLDTYMAAKAARGHMSHLLIDRFRFDSFTVEQDRTADSRLLSRFGHEIYLFFMVTSPVETVPRAWFRGLSTGRFKAVDDLLHHNVEAYTGMPALFLSWAAVEGRRVHFEFLDNDVPEGTLPATGAFGWSHHLTVLDVRLMRAIDRNRAVNVAATRPEDVLPALDDTEQADDWSFVRDCIQRIRRVDFADRDTATLLARIEDRQLVWADTASIAERDDAQEIHAIIDKIPVAEPVAEPVAGPVAGADVSPCPELPSGPAPAPIDVVSESRLTVGRWASRVSGGKTSSAPERV